MLTNNTALVVLDGRVYLTSDIVLPPGLRIDAAESFLIDRFCKSDRKKTERRGAMFFREFQSTMFFDRWKVSDEITRAAAIERVLAGKEKVLDPDTHYWISIGVAAYTIEQFMPGGRMPEQFYTFRSEDGVIAVDIIVLDGAVLKAAAYAVIDDRLTNEQVREVWDSSSWHLLSLPPEFTTLESRASFFNAGKIVFM